MGAAVATAALLAGFGAAILVYGPLGTPFRQIGGTTLNVPPAGVSFGDARIVLATALAENNTSYGLGSLNLSWSYSPTGSVIGPCNTSGVWGGNNSSAAFSNETWPVADNTTLVCLNSVMDGNVSAMWYGAALNNSYNAVSGVVNGSYYTTPGGGNISSCDNFTLFHELQGPSSPYNGSYIPCQTYFEQNANTNKLTSFNGTNATESLWSPNQTGYAPSDMLYVLPVYFSNATANGTYEVTVAIAGVTPVAQSFYFSDNGSAVGSGTVVFAFDMTAAWLMDLTVNATGAAFNVSLMPVYATIGVTSMIVSECGLSATGPVCPIVAAPRS